MRRGKWSGLLWLSTCETRIMTRRDAEALVVSSNLKINHFLEQGIMSLLTWRDRKSSYPRAVADKEICSFLDLTHF